MKNPRKMLSIILTIITTVCLLAVGAILIKTILTNTQSQQELESLRASAAALLDDLEETGDSASDESAFDESTSLETQNDAKATGSADSTTDETPLRVMNPYKDSYASNEDMAAWLQIPDTVVDYPVMWTPRDEEYYLRRNFEGKSDTAGCLILDTDSCLDPLATNLLIHGHNMRAGTMFGHLTDYEDEEYYQNHKQIILYTEECQRNYEVIAVFRSQVYKKSDSVFKFYKFFQANTPEEFDDFYSNIKEMSIYDTGVTAEYGDHFLTLSTCVYHVDRGRFVVVAKEVESGDHYLPVSEAPTESE